MPRRLIPNARRAWRWFSVQALAVLIALPILFETLPPEVMAVIPGDWQPWIIAVVALAGMIGRFVDQDGD